MKLIVNLANDSLEELKKAIEVLQQVIKNKQQGEHFTKGLDKFNVNDPRAHPEKLSCQARKMIEQEKIMPEMDLSKILERKYKKKF